MVEHSAVNRGVVGSSPTRGAQSAAAAAARKPAGIHVCGFPEHGIKKQPNRFDCSSLCHHREQDTGSEPASSAWEADILPMY